MDNKYDTNFTVRAYGKSELAMLYFPMTNAPHTAVNRLMSWIKRCKGLQEALLQVGYAKSAKYFTPKEVGIIVEYLGNP